ncbi:gluconate 2-dehydrogenase subunit 3 family protein [Galbibacter sp. EGI 63066]|uniref:gluconate 2-dehydrogenase subunit 3 family protein n=1 Tax=Galbibacter sp. EGI 63066 TaxID=2993559 RepID=UPI0022497206|nr:gluconate 2-dehydrogenase subunit 3 family protein [Galbibacter sp. EGI 63066]MCX2678835.1 gluconate 2-dehydrogenase subunit 3 family protein [Galbibacter sp. EGI 63066]
MMNRRKALRNIGLTTGFVVATPTLVSMLQSCTADKATWVPEFFTAEEGIALTNIVDVIIPKTDTPSASEVNVPQFLDKYVKEVESDETQAEYRKKMAGLVKQLKADYNENLAEITPEEYEDIVVKNLKAERKEGTNRVIIEGKEVDMDMGSESGAAENNQALAYSMVNDLRWSTINAYKNSQKIGEEVLAYDPVPGVYTGCMPVEEATQGKAWSL